MNKFNKNLLLGGLALALSTGALADRGKHHGWKHGKAFDERVVYAKVVKVKPIYREIRVVEPVRECWSEPVREVREIRYDRGGNRAGNTLAGAIIGGVIGHQIGKGRGRKLATAVGTIVGAQLGHDAAGASGAHATRSVHTRVEEVCKRSERVRYEEEIEGYRVTYRYQGEKYSIRMPYDPGSRIKLRLRVEPVF